MDAVTNGQSDLAKQLIGMAGRMNEMLLPRDRIGNVVLPSPVKDDQIKKLESEHLRHEILLDDIRKILSKWWQDSGYEVRDLVHARIRKFEEEGR